MQIQSEYVCDTGFDEPEPELGWKLDAERQEAMQKAKCSQIKSVFQRTARSCQDVKFLALEVREA